MSDLIKCPRCALINLTYTERPVLTQQLIQRQGEEPFLLPSTIYRNDAKDVKLTCRDCDHSFDPPAAFYELDLEF